LLYNYGLVIFWVGLNERVFYEKYLISRETPKEKLVGTGTPKNLNSPHQKPIAKTLVIE